MTADPTADTDPSPDPVVPEQDPDPSRTANVEAARYRTRLRDTEAVRDALAARVERFERATVERVAAETLSSPGDVWLFTAADALPRTPEGEVDTDAVRAAVAKITEGRPGLAIPPKRVVDTGGGRRGDPLPSEPSWASIINPSARNA